MAVPHPAHEACLSAQRGAVQEVEKSEAASLRELVPGTPTCPLSPPHQARLGEFHFQDHPSAAHVSPRPFGPSGFSILGRAKKTVGVPTLSALGTVLTCNHSGKQPPAGLGRGRRGEGELQQTRQETKASSGALRLTVGWVPRLQGPAQAGLPWRSQAVPALLGSVLLAAGQLLELCVGPGTQGLEVLKVLSREEEKKGDSRAANNLGMYLCHHTRGPGVALELF